MEVADKAAVKRYAMRRTMTLKAYINFLINEDMRKPENEKYLNGD